MDYGFNFFFIYKVPFLNFIEIKLFLNLQKFLFLIKLMEIDFVSHFIKVLVSLKLI